MREYELVYVIQPDATPEREEEIHDRTDALIMNAGGRFLLRDDWGKRKLAYEIKNFQKGHYFQLDFLGKGPEIAELERSLRLDADVLRFLSIQVNDEVKDIESRIQEAEKQAEEQARRREERARAEAERERERMEAERKLVEGDEDAREDAQDDARDEGRGHTEAGEELGAAPDADESKAVERED